MFDFTLSNTLYIVLVITIPCLSVIFFQFILMFFKGKEEITNNRKNLFLYRKFQHASTALFIVVLNEILSRNVAFWATFSGFLFLLLVEVVRRKNSRFNKFYLEISSSVLREEEKERFSSAFFFLLGTTIIQYFCSKDIVSMTVLFIGIGDPFASISGILIVTPRIYKEKSISGFLGCGISCAVSYCIYVYTCIYFSHNNALLSSYVTIKAITFGLIAGLVDFLCVFFGNWDDNLVFQLLFSFVLTFTQRHISL